MFTPGNEVVSFIREDADGKTGYSEDYRQEYSLTRRQIYFGDEDVKAAYRLAGDALTLRFEGDGGLTLVRAAAPAPEALR
jgi:hypothetical protein